MSNTFSVDGFARDAQAAIKSAETVKDQQVAVKELMTKMYAENSTDTIVERLNAAVPPGANLAEMILFAEDDLTLLWGQVPPRFQSAIHNHAVWANIMAVIGPEKNIIFKEDASGDGTLNVAKEVTVQPGEVLELAPDAIHCIENPTTSPARAFHVYGGNFKALDDERDLWSWKAKDKIHFSLEGVMKESLVRMADGGNDVGLNAVAKAVPKLEPIVEKLKGSAAQGKEGTEAQ